MANVYLSQERRNKKKWQSLLRSIMVTVKGTSRLGRQNNLRLLGNLPGKLASTSLPHYSPSRVPRFARFVACARSLHGWEFPPGRTARCEETPAGVCAKRGFVFPIRSGDFG